MANISKITLPDGSSYDIKDTSKQEIITASGILKGDGAGTITAAVAGTDYQEPITNLDSNEMMYVNSGGTIDTRKVVDGYTIVNSLPTTNIDTNTVYLVPSSSSGGGGGGGGSSVTYTLSISGSVITLTGSDSSTSSVTLPIYDGTVV